MPDIKQNDMQFDMNTGWQWWSNHWRRSKGNVLAYIWNRFQWNYFHRFNLVPRFPLNIDVESSSACDIKCDHCFRQYMDMKENEFMSMEVYKKIVDECAQYGLYTLKFSMRAEPT